MPSSPNTSLQVPSSLEDDAFEVLGDSTLLTSDDEDGNTESLASYDSVAPDDVSNTADADAESVHNDHGVRAFVDDDASSVEEDDTLDKSTNLQEDEGADSTMTTRPEGSPWPPSPAWENATQRRESVYLTFLHTVSQDHMNEAQLAYEKPQIGVSLELVLAQHDFQLERPLRVLYVGDEPAPLFPREEIINKIGSALAAATSGNVGLQNVSGGSSRYTVVPVSDFGTTGSAPEVEVIESLGSQITVDHCSGAKGHYDANGQLRSIALVMNGLETRRFLSCNNSHRRFELDVDLPDFILYFLSDANLKCLEDVAWFELVNEVMLPYDAPCLFVTETASFGQSSWPIPNALAHGMRLILTSGSSKCRDFEWLGQIPVDLGTFMSMDARCLNRHLAYITDLSKAGGARKLRRSRQLGQLDAPDQDTGLRSSKLRTLQYQHWAAIFLFITSLITFACSSALTWYSSSTQVSSEAQVASQRAALSSAIANLTNTTGVNCVAKIEDIVFQQTTQSVDTTVPSASADPKVRKDLALSLGNDPLPIKLHRIGNSHLLFTLPKSLISIKRASSVRVNVTRELHTGEHEQVNTTMVQLADGVYAVGFQDDQAYGPITVAISSASKPAFNQTIQIGLGSRWLKSGTYTENPAQVLGKAFTDLWSSARAFSKAVGTTLYQLPPEIDSKKIRNFVNKETSTVQQLFSGKAKALRRAAIADKFGKLSAQYTNTSLYPAVRLYNETSKAFANLQRVAGTVGHSVSQSITLLFQAAKEVDLAKAWKDTPPIRKTEPAVKARRNALRFWDKLSKKTSTPEAKIAPAVDAPRRFELFGKRNPTAQSAVSTETTVKDKVHAHTECTKKHAKNGRCLAKHATGQQRVH
ncbi:hypothetical protein LTR16_003354 [Cryomyces antarcticus]|uniref:Transmembrane protein n=1 Tax=Cryomyces antarcticus TaxID=329879 RepID=A0ABR0LY45_9PEZI|nr:hypothetical protein LTR16_003354 [Cryomyces antarcticus]